MAISLSLMGSILGLLPLLGVMLIVLCSVERSAHFSLVASDTLAPVSFRVWHSVLMVLLVEAISWSISVSVGMNGILSSGLKCGRSHVFPRNFRNKP